MLRGTMLSTSDIDAVKLLAHHMLASEDFGRAQVDRESNKCTDEKRVSR
jgi:hypothetical protein